MSENIAVVLAGGEGRRLRPLTYAIPKPLLPIADKPILEILLRQFKKYGFTRVFLAVGYKHELIERHFQEGLAFGVHIDYSIEKERLGTAAPLRLMAKELDRPFLVVNGDILLKADFSKMLTYHTTMGADLTVATKKHSIKLQYGMVDVENGRISKIREKPTIESIVGAGAYIMNPGLLELIPTKSSFDMPDLIQAAIEAHKKVLSYDIGDFWLHLGRLDDYEKACEEFKNGIDWV
jgi:NDP-sugar pyrophosphorylase family protein